MSLTHYNRIQQHSSDATDLLGVALPQLTAATVNITTQLLTTDEMIQHITAFNPTQGWLMLRDKVQITANAPGSDDVIEAEYSNGSDSLTVKLVAHNQYSVVTFTLSNNNDHSMAYQDQSVFIRKPSDAQGEDESKCAIYRLWWQQELSGSNEGRWQPVAQQFVGFDSDEESK